MDRRTRLSDEERRALSTAPPQDERGRPQPWRLAGRAIEDEEFSGPVVHDGLEVEDAAFRGFTWSGAPVLRGGAFRDVAFERVRLVGVRFEGVTFERCTFEEARFEGCALVGCRFVGGEVKQWTTRRTQLRDVEFAGVTGDGWTLREGEITGCALRDCTLTALRVASAGIDRVVVEGGSVHSAELTITEIGALTISGAAVTRLRVVGGSARSLALVDVDGDDVSFADCRVEALRLERCPALINPRVLDCHVGALTVDRCASVLGLVVQNCEVGRLSLVKSTLQHTTLADVRAAGPLQVDDCGLTGLVVRDGAWRDASLVGARIEEYVAIDRARFTSLQRRGVVEGAGVQYQLDGALVADAASLWGAVHGP